MSESIYPGQTWCRLDGVGAVRIWLVDADRVGFRRSDETIGYMPRARFLATFRRVRAS